MQDWSRARSSEAQPCATQKALQLLGGYFEGRSSVDIVLYLLQRTTGYDFQRLAELSIAMVSCFLVFKYLDEMHHRSLIS